MAMYKLNSSEHLNYLVGKELIQVCVGLYQVILRFTDELSISIECLYKITNEEDGSIDASGDNPHATINFVDFLGYSIESIHLKSDHELAINFSNNWSLILIADHENTESFVITGKTFQIVI